MDIKSNTLIKQFGYSDANYHSTISSDGKYLAFTTWTSTSNYNLYLYDLNTYLQIAKLGTFANINDIQFSPDGKYIAAGGEDSTLRIFDVEQRKLIKEINYPNSWTIKKISFTHNNKYLIVNVGYFRHFYLFVYNTENFEQIYDYKNYYGFNFDVSNNSNYIVTSGYLTGSWNIYLLNKKWTDVKVIEPLKESEIIYPNPTNGLITLNFNQQLPEITNINLNDIYGILIRNLFNNFLEPGQQELSFDVNDLANGTYFIIVSNSHLSLVFKLIVNK